MLNTCASLDCFLAAVFVQSMAAVAELEELHQSLQKGTCTADAVLQAAEAANAREPGNVEVLFLCARAKFDQSRTQPDDKAKTHDACYDSVTS